MQQSPETGNSWYGLLADLIVSVHVAYVAFVIVGLLLILLGGLLRWRWVRNLRFRVAHFLAILIVALEAVAGLICPLTTWEFELRKKAGQDTDEGTFMGRLMHDILFYEAPPWVFTSAYIVFALLVLSTLFLIPPRWRTRA